MQNDDYDNTPFAEPVVIEITDSFDLHTIQPREVKAAVEEYLHLAHERGFSMVRIIHGKGSVFSAILSVASSAERNLCWIGQRRAQRLGDGERLW